MTDVLHPHPRLPATICGVLALCCAAILPCHAEQTVELSSPQAKARQTFQQSGLQAGIEAIVEQTRALLPAGSDGVSVLSMSAGQGVLFVTTRFDGIDAARYADGTRREVLRAQIRQDMAGTICSSPIIGMMISEFGGRVHESIVNERGDEMVGFDIGQQDCR